MFYLPFSPDELRQAYDNEKTPGAHQNMRPLLEIEQIYEMVKFVSVRVWDYEYDENHDQIPVLLGIHVRDKPIHYYNCKNLLPSGDCGIYSTRPTMCSDYPYGKSCVNPDCQADVYKLPQVTGPCEEVGTPCEENT